MNNKNKMHNSKKAQHERKSDDLLNVLMVRWENKYSLLFKIAILPKEKIYLSIAYMTVNLRPR